MKKSSTDVVLTPVVDALIVVLMLVFMALLTYAGNKPPKIEIIKPNKALIKQNNPDKSILKISDPDGDRISLTFNRFPNFIDTSMANDTLLISINPQRTTEKRVYDFWLTASTAENKVDAQLYPNSSETTKHRITFTVVGQNENDNLNRPPRIKTLTTHPLILEQNITSYSELEIIDPDGDKIFINIDDMPKFVDTSFDQGLLTMTFEPTKMSEKKLYDFWIKVNDKFEDFDSLRITFDVTGHAKRKNTCGDITGIIRIHVFSLDEIVCQIKPAKSTDKKEINILDKNYESGDFITKMMTKEEFKSWSEKLEKWSLDGNFEKRGECLFSVWIYPYQELSGPDLTKISSICEQNFFYKQMDYFDKPPLYERYNRVRNYKDLKKQVESEANSWF